MRIHARILVAHVIAALGAAVVTACSAGDGSATQSNGAATAGMDGGAPSQSASTTTGTSAPIARVHTTKALPPPPTGGPGCYERTAAGWESRACAEDSSIDSEFGRPTAPPALSISSTPNGTPIAPLVFGELEVTLPKVGTVVDLPSGSGADAAAGTPNRWSVQNNTNFYAGSNGHTDWEQFVLQANGSSLAICIWNVDVTTQSYPKTCYAPAPPQRSGGLQANDYAIVAAYANAATKQLSMVVETSWAASGQPTQYAVVSNDTNGLAGQWSDIGGEMMGLGNGSTAIFSNTEAWATLTASTCVGDTQANSPTCAATPTLQPNAILGLSEYSAEGNNLTWVGPESLSYPNADLAVATIVETPTGSCLTSACAGQPVPEAPGCVPTSTCSQEYFPAGYGSPVGYHTIETVSFACQRTPTSALQNANDVFTPLGPNFIANAEYSSSSSANVFNIGTQSTTGATTSGAPVGSVLSVQACANNICDPPANITVASCCQPVGCGATQCGSFSNGCGGTNNCTGGCTPPPVCPVKACVAGMKWNAADCACERVCTTAACACVAAGGDWNGHTCS